MRVMGSQWLLPPEPKMPPGLFELMEGLTRDVLRHNPPNVLQFCTRHMQRLLEIRDGRAPKIPLTLDEKIRRAQEKMRQKAEERRFKYDEAMKGQFQTESEATQGETESAATQGETESAASAATQGTNQIESDSEVEKEVQESIRVPIPVHEDLKNDKEVEISHETFGSLKKSIEGFDEAVIAETYGDNDNTKHETNTDTTEDGPLSANNAENESYNPETDSCEEHPLIKKSIEEFDRSLIAETDGNITNDVQLKLGNNAEDGSNRPKSAKDVELNTESNNLEDESNNPEANSLEDHLEINTEEKVNAHATIDSDKVIENGGTTKDVQLSTDTIVEGESNNPETNSPEEHLEINTDTEDKLNAHATINSDIVSKTTKDMHLSTEHNVEGESNTPETYPLDENSKNNTGDKVDSINKQLFLDNHNKENISDTHEKNMSDTEELNREVNFELNTNNEDSKTETVDKNEESKKHDDSTIDNIDPVNIDNIDPANIAKQPSGDDKVKGNTQDLHTKEKTTENERIAEVLGNESKETIIIITPEMTLELTESNDNFSEVSESKCEKKIISTLAVPVNNIIIMNHGDVMHKTENPDSNIAFSFQESVKNDSLPEITVENKIINEKEKLVGKTKESEIDKEKLHGTAEEQPAAAPGETQIIDLNVVENPTIENKIISEKENLRGTIESNLPAELIGEIQVIDLHIVENLCSENNSQIERNDDVLDEDSESDFILKHADLDEISNQFDSSNTTGESTLAEKLIERRKDENKINDENKIADENKIEDETKIGDENNSTSNMDLETAAVTIQKHFRMFLFKSRDRETFDDDQNSTDEEADKKLVEYQMSPLNKERRGLCRMDSVLQTVNEEKSLSLSTDDSASSAATVIQARVRGYLVRKRLDSYKTASISTPDDRSMSSDEQKEKKVLNIHIVPKGEDFITRDESILESIDLSLDGSPPSSNRHPLGYDKSEPRKQLKREDAVQSGSPPTSNNGKVSVEVDNSGEKNSKEGVNKGDKNNKEVDKGEKVSQEGNNNGDKISQEEDNNGEQITEEVDSIKNTIEIYQTEQQKDDSISESTQDQDARSCETTPSRSMTVETVIEIHKEKVHTPEVEGVKHEEADIISRSSDGRDVATPIDDNSTDSDSTSKLLHSGEFHDILLPSPTQISRSNTTVVREFKIVLGFFLLWK